MEEKAKTVSLSLSSPSFPPSEIHLLPCNIHYDGPESVSNYFRPSPSLSLSPSLSGGTGTGTELLSNFRGRRLVGRVVSLPEHTAGVVMEVVNKETIRTHQSFSHFTVWEHDIQPDTRVIQDALDWIDIADAVS